MPQTVQLAPLTAAVDRVAAQAPVTSPLRTADWAAMRLAFRERAFFSAGIEDAHYIATAQKSVLSVLSVAREQTASGQTAFVDREAGIRAIRQAALQGGLGTGEQPGNLSDPASRARAALIVDRNVQAARGYSNWTVGQDQDILDAFPAQELIYRAVARQPRGLAFWQNRWQSAGGALIDGRMVALKTDGIWTAINDFGVPWPPFAWGSRGTRLRDIGRRQAIQLGLLKPDAVVAPIAKDFNANLEASTENLPDDLIEGLLDVFGDQLIRDGAKLIWRAFAA